MILNPATTTIIYFILVYPFTHKVFKALGKQQLSGWKCPERLCPGLLLERDREAQSCSPARSPGWLQRLRGSFQVVPHRSLCPSSCHWPLSSLQSMQVPTRVGLAGGEGKLKQLLPPSLLQKDCRDPGSAVGDSAHCLQAAESLPQLSPEKTSGLSH